MKKSKLIRILSVAMAVVLGTASLTACSGSGKDDSKDSKKIVMTYLTAGKTPTDMEEVVAAINKISKEKIGVEIEYKPVSVYEAGSKYTTWIASKEPMDLMMVAFTNLSTFISQGMIVPIDDLIEKDAPDINNLRSEGPITQTSVYDDKTYGVSPMGLAGTGGSYLIDKPMLEETGLDYKDQQKVTLDDLDKIFKAIKAKHPDVYPCGVTGQQSAFSFTQIVDPLGGTTSSGVVLGTDSTKVVDMYETEEYKSFLKYMNKWFKAGYIQRDAATTDQNNTALYKSGVTAGYFADGQTGMKSTALANGKEFVQLQLLDPYVTSGSLGSGAFWTIPTTCKDPDSAMKFLNLMFSDKDVVNLIQWGIEGKHYKFIDKDKGIIGFPDGITSDTCGYYCPIGVYGDTRMLYTNDINSDYDAAVAFSNKANENKTKVYGFFYDSSKFESEIVAIDGVVIEYEAALATGSADFDKTYPQFIKDLKDNGIDKVIADKQSQFNDWLAKQ